VSPSSASTDEFGSRSYRLTLDPEGAAVLEAAIGPLSAPVPGPDGERDLRSPQTRRGQALVEVCRRATAAADRPPPGVKATLLLTMSHDDLAARSGAGVILGSTATGTLLAPEQVRRLARDAVIPAVLGSRGELLDLGRSTRLATPAQLTALWWRDRGCTFPGCGTPPHGCDAHHVQHWIDGGATDPGNLALLCGRHHTIVHRDRLTARIDPSAGTVSWETDVGSYLGARGSSPPGWGPADMPHRDRHPAAASTLHSRPQETRPHEVGDQGLAPPPADPPPDWRALIDAPPECDPWFPDTHPAA
jgi:hypothetical protein